MLFPVGFGPGIPTKRAAFLEELGFADKPWAFEPGLDSLQAIPPAVMISPSAKVIKHCFDKIIIPPSMEVLSASFYEDFNKDFMSNHIGELKQDFSFRY